MTELSFRRVLVANRGEIAVRVSRACRDLGIESVAVYSSADRDAVHVHAADRAVEIGPPPPLESYLSIERLLAAADASGADAIHPGYGFLAENPDFASAVMDNGLFWIGPLPESIRLMGEKTTARETMANAGVPVTPGSLTPMADPSSAAREAARIGYPVLLKAAAGGGGKGMRVVGNDDEMESAFGAASREAAGAFGNPALYVEKYLTDARHVEVQVLADREGKTIHLGERECSLQRRHQKVVEEAPAPGLSDSTRSAMGDIAVKAARAVDYVGAGTVEFLMMPDERFYFLEMNTRIQVEHPVTEWVTGVDLVIGQITIASGLPLDLTQDDVRHRGHALECRIVAEDPANGFLPATGVIDAYHEPGGPGVRFDSGVELGSVVTTHYDPLLAKCIVWAPTRDRALDRMDRALRETTISGVTTNLAFQRQLLRIPEVRGGRVHTRFLELLETQETPSATVDRAMLAALAAFARDRSRNGVAPTKRSTEVADDRWRSARTWLWYR